MGNLRVPFPGNKGLLTNNDGEYNFLARPFFFPGKGGITHD